MKSLRCNRLYILLRGPNACWRDQFTGEPEPIGYRLRVQVWVWRVWAGHRAYCGCDL